MSTQRPFFANFIAAFRAHSAITQQTKTSPTTQTTHTTTTTAAASSPPSHPRSISTASKPTGATTSALTQLHSPRTHSTSPLSRSPGPASTSPGAYVQPSGVPTRDRIRRGSDSSSEGFRDVLGADKWYIGGRTATGEERFFKLGVVRRHRSIDRLSLDRLSL
jgi:hypothetical protein